MLPNGPSLTCPDPDVPPFLPLAQMVMAQLMNFRAMLCQQLTEALAINRQLLSGQKATETSHTSATTCSPKLDGVKVEESSSGPACKLVTGRKNGRIIRKRRGKEDRLSLSSKKDTKNIPKNYGKAILRFIFNSPLTRIIAGALGLNLLDFLMQIYAYKSKINSIEGLKNMWGHGELNDSTKKCIRILSYHFMRKESLSYIFKSKIRNFGVHIKCRQKIIQGIENPAQFNHIKYY